jgi:hypothetical protein
MCVALGNGDFSLLHCSAKSTVPLIHQLSSSHHHYLFFCENSHHHYWKPGISLCANIPYKTYILCASIPYKTYILQLQYSKYQSTISSSI